MKQIRMTAILLAAALLLSLCCVGCAKDPIETAANVSTAKPDPALTETLTENTEATEPIPAAVAPERLKNGGQLRFRWYGGRAAFQDIDIACGRLRQCVLRPVEAHRLSHVEEHLAILSAEGDA